MEGFWQRIKTQIQELKILDQDNMIVFGSNWHRYEILPPVGLSNIESYEAIHGTRLPDSYRDYLQCFGSGGVGPGGGINKFPENIWQGDLSKSLQLDLFRGYQLGDEPFPPSLEKYDGMIEIGGYVYEQSHYLVINGPLRGYVVGWNGADLLCVSGPFDKWYERWINCVVLGIRHFEAMKKIQVGMHFDTLVKSEKLVVSHTSKNKYVSLYCIDGKIELDDKGQVENVNMERLSVAKNGFELWPYGSLTYVD